MKYYYPIFVLLLLSCKERQRSETSDICFMRSLSQNVEEISLKDIEKIWNLNGHFVKLEGILHYSFEDVALYPSKHSDVKEAIWLNLIVPDEIPELQLEKMDGKKATIIGKINTSNKGHYGAYIATLDSAFCIKIK